MQAYYGNIEKETLDNTNFRKVLYTGAHTQLVVMSLNPGEEIGTEVHDTVDQFFRIEQGTAQFIIDGQSTEAGPDQVVIIPAGSQHNVESLGPDTLKLYTLYSPPNHPPNTIHATKTEADEAEKHHH